jgi:hypothetical protein
MEMEIAEPKITPTKQDLRDLGYEIVNALHAYQRKIVPEMCGKLSAALASIPRFSGVDANGEAMVDVDGEMIRGAWETVAWRCVFLQTDFIMFKTLTFVCIGRDDSDVVHGCLRSLRQSCANLRDLLLDYAGDEELSEPQLELLQYVFETLRDECSAMMEKVMETALRFVEMAEETDLDTHCDVEDEIETAIQDWGEGMRHAKEQYETEIRRLA